MEVRCLANVIQMVHWITDANHLVVNAIANQMLLEEHVHVVVPVIMGFPTASYVIVRQLLFVIKSLENAFVQS